MNSRFTPLVALTLALCLGILLAGIAGSIALVLLAAVPCTLILHFKKEAFPSLRAGVFELCLVLSISGIGAALGLSAAFLPANHVSAAIGQELCLQGLVAEGSVPTARGQKAVLDVQGDYCGKVLLYLPMNAAPVAHHSEVRVVAQLQGLPQGNAGYARYLRSQGILATAKVNEVEAIGRVSGIGYTLTELRHSVSRRLEANMIDPRMRGLANAMFVGDRSQLAADLRNDFSATGLSHILSISGMHVTLFYMFLNFLLGFMGNRLAGRHLRTALILSALVVYMGMTGFSPAVCRAVFMLSMLRLSESFFLEKNTLNVLALSAFILLLVDPLLLFDLGFQLSYLAVFGLIVVAPRMEQLFESRMPWMPGMLRSALTMSLAAQVMTTPLVLFHFGQFPAYFLVANLVLLPIVTVATYLGIAAMLFCWVPVLGTALGVSLDTLLMVVAVASNWIAGLPGAVATSCRLSDPGFCVLMATLLPIAIAAAHVEVRMAYRWICQSGKGEMEIRMQPAAITCSALILAIGGIVIFA